MPRDAIPCHVVDGKNRPLRNRHGHQIVVQVPVEQEQLDRIVLRYPVPQLHLTDQDGETGWFHVTSLREIKP